MDLDQLHIRGFENEFKLQAVRSAGPGGQNVNKVSSKVELRFGVNGSKLLSDNEKLLIVNRLANRINTEGELVITCQTDRSQLKNREQVVAKFYVLLARALTVAAARKPSKPTFSSKMERLEKKRIHSQRKESRRRFSGDE